MPTSLHEALARASEAERVSLNASQRRRRASAAPAPLTVVDLRANRAAEEALEACEQRALVRAMLNALEPREREILRLRFGDDLSQVEIARQPGISQSTASRLLTGSLGKLRQRLDPTVDRAA